ncbi:S9 family peptidase [Algoriphagus hitonicola]|uniref:Dipeptidyl aminopeptidase/acylaminoacyl peptidase n=1 Tax=Algoriphagus hitonicola TaxID=435880 RepID=A0A1I2T0I6_9BACT|nr:prolyl oligopeptidase family serine peptidase [Algoriphagus hitonicola]SFG56717.1 Dipeptidyl aminopeptidase/acylaminoacyl peptidase [Algoriphagus hitonicola]
MKIRLLIILFLCSLQSVFSQSFTIEQVGKFTFPSGLTADHSGTQLAWVMYEQGKRNVYYAKAPDFQPEKLTSFDQDNGQEISGLSFTPEGNHLVFVRGGDHGGGNASSTVNADNLTKLPKVELFAIDLPSRMIEGFGEGDNIHLGNFSDILFLKNGQVWKANAHNVEEPYQLFEIKGTVNSMEFSPNGKSLAFTVNRSGHQLIGIYRDSETPIQFIAPSFHRYSQPKWSPDGSKIAFIKTLGGTGAAYPLLEPRHSPWEIWQADVASGKAEMLWKAPETLPGSYRYFFFSYPNENELVFESYHDGWQHLYSLDLETKAETLLTPGDYMVEQINISPDGKKVLFSANFGPTKEDQDRRHIGTVELASKKLTWETDGKGIEAYPVALSENGLAYFSATAQRPHLVTIKKENETKLLQADLIPSDFPEDKLVTPKQVQFTAPDGTTVFGQLFEKEGGSAKKPGIVFIHGGPQRQMLLGWSYMDYYTNTYALNQYLAEMGFVVLSVNFRLGIGYGYDFHRPANAYYQGAVEYQDIKAGGEYLANLSQVDANKIGVYGGSYGGYLTALALARDSDLFKVGVDIHGVHDLDSRYELPEGYEVAPDYEEAKKIAWESSPIADLDTWTSPVLFIHSDDDRNVNVAQTTNLIRRFDELKKPYESILIPGDTHHWMKWENMIRVSNETANFLKKHLMD